jgi:hypothetical protein
MSEYLTKNPDSLKRPSDDSKNEAVDRFTENGFAVLNDIFDVDLIEDMKVLAENSFRALQDHLRTNNLVLGIGIKEGYKEVVQRHLNRFEMPYRMENCIFDRVANNLIVQDVVRGILGPGFTIVNRSLILSLPGAAVSRQCAVPSQSFYQSHTILSQYLLTLAQ